MTTERKSEERDIAKEYREAAQIAPIIIQPTPAQEKALEDGGGFVPDEHHTDMEGGMPVDR